jgi:nitroreductase
MELTEALKSRRSVRAYKANTVVEKSVVEELIKAAQLAPSWKNSQTARYYVVMNKEKINTIRENYLPESNRKKTENVPVLIITAFETKHPGFTKEKEPENELGDQWGAYDLGLQNENLVLKAREFDLDTLIIGIRNSEGIRKELNIPESQNIAAVIALGYRDCNPTMPKRKELEEIVKFF